MVAEGEGAQVEALLVRRFRRESRPAGTTPVSAGRTAGELLAAAEARRAAREQAEARAKEEARALRAAEQTAAYERRLQNLTGRTEETWHQVAELTVFSKPKEYDQATLLLRDLHVIAQREDDIQAFTARVRELRTRYANGHPDGSARQGRTAIAGKARRLPSSDCSVADRISPSAVKKSCARSSRSAPTLIADTGLLAAMQP
jgi:hypothetical protein